VLQVLQALLVFKVRLVQGQSELLVLLASLAQQDLVVEIQALVVLQVFKALAALLPAQQVLSDLLVRLGLLVHLVHLALQAQPVCRVLLVLVRRELVWLEPLVCLVLLVILVLQEHQD
jgi:hypothetical protein